ncbi:MAG: hypothetical protein GTO46_04175 [Gemmatimonadetes bacterium]|nr:hypothetical protein [Gemmatimonadota bacterium]NIO30920.1 hypothetical protein [Gemmatimonadota bacterium]
MADLAKIAREAVDAFNASDWERTKALVTPDYLYNEVGTQRRIQGPEEVVAALQGWKQAMPDAKGTVTSALASGNTVALEITWEGTHTGPLEGPTGTIPASGKRQVTPAAQILIFEGDKIKENHHYFDMMSLLKQIGALK